MAAGARQPAAGGRRRILRIGVLLGGKIVEERLIRDRAAVSIGQSSKNTFSVPLENLPREFVLFGIDGDQYKLQFGPKMDGRVSDGAQVYTLEQVKGSRAVQVGDHWVMPLSDAARGKVSMGDLTLLFQFVTEPPVQPRPMLPASVRGSLVERVDPRLAVIVAISLVIHFGVAIAAWLHDRPKKRTPVRAAMQTVDVETIDMQTPELPPVPDTAVGEEKVVDKGEDKKPDKSTKPSTDKGDKTPKPDRGGGPTSDEEKAALQEEAARYVATLVGGSEAAGGAADMGKTAPGGDLDQQTKEVKEGNSKVEIGGNKGGTRGGGDPRKGTGTGPKTSETGGTTDPGKGEEKVPKGRVKLTGTKGLDSDVSLTPDQVTSRIQSVYMAALQKCYKDELKTDPSLRAKASLEFEVNEKGRVTSPKSSSESSSLDKCIESRMQSWTFNIPKDGDGEATTAAFKISLQFVPE